MRWRSVSIPCSLLISSLALGAAEIESGEPAVSWDQAFPLANASLGALVFSGTAADRILLFPPRPSGELGAEFPAGTLLAHVIGFARKAGQGGRFSWLTPTERPPLATLHLDWLPRDREKATDFSRSLALADGIASSRFQLGGAGLVQDVLCSATENLLAIHLRADKPGSLSFRIRLDSPADRPAELRVEDRRILILHGKTSEAQGAPEFEARVWIFPMESEVTPAEKDISVLGEGEALALVSIARGPAGSPEFTALADRLKKFGFGGDDPPDIEKLWEDLKQSHLDAYRPLMRGKEGQ